MKKNFLEFIAEERWSDYNGMTANGQMLTVSIEKSPHNNMMEVIVSGKRSLSKLKSAARLKGEYAKSEWDEIEKRWAELSKEKSAKLESLVNDFELELNKLVIEMEKEFKDM